METNPNGTSASAVCPFFTSLKCGDSERIYFAVLNTALESLQVRAQSSASAILDADEAADDDIVIRAVLHGWPAVGGRYILDPAWPLPAYMTPTTTQKSITHPVLTDFFVWPHFRDYLTTSGMAAVTERDAAAFATNLQFHWPYEVRDLCRRHKETGLYSYSEMFDKAFNDLGSWTLHPEFFRHSPLPPLLQAPAPGLSLDPFQLQLCGEQGFVWNNEDAEDTTSLSQEPAIHELAGISSRTSGAYQRQTSFDVCSSTRLNATHTEMWPYPPSPY
ncbi:uncharacterized protein Z518_01474 [Rhinocladiella mackenziei CBS 650.93]|uniref:Uncharacterized protein n=1 Tax=Rhinocladiella mackenziei CBS 650.93 TaxID=1442369 RepID=A0A0D2G623_9EURO|nr:uncharacterized protein Z518_01474 [Rhinocladiella mackenziei CBS 650.93]KIX10392.1 hypothetical protein Z518_01474 [Rhinocladiella mackenziei CBS 650.93]